MAFRFSHWRRLPDSLPLFWRLQIVGWTGYALDRLLQAPGDFVPVPLTYIAVAFGLSLCLRLLYRRLWRRSPPLWQIGATAVGGSIVAAYLWLAISQYSFWMRGIWPWPKIGHSTILLVTLEETLTHHKPFLFLSWSALYFGIKYWQREQEQQSRALRAGVLAKEAELALLRYQLNPHFLFNSLNSVSALVREDPDGAERMLNELSEFLRLALSRAAAGEAPLRDELDAARKYLAIEKIRFEDKLVVAFEIEAEAEGFRVPSLLLQPLIENAIKHGWQTSALPLQVTISARGTADRLRLEIGNTGRLATKAGAGHGNGGAGIGLENVRRRLEQAFPARHRFTLDEGDGRVTAVVELERQ